MAFAIPGGILIASSLEFTELREYDIDVSNGGALAAGGLLILVGMLVVFVLFVRAMGKTGQTWGSKIVGVKVVLASNGETIGFGKALGRTLFAGFISANVFYLGFLWMIWDDEKQTWQDKVVKSIVIKV